MLQPSTYIRPLYLGVLVVYLACSHFGYVYMYLIVNLCAASDIKGRGGKVSPVNVMERTLLLRSVPSEPPERTPAVILDCTRFAGLLQPSFERTEIVVALFLTAGGTYRCPWN
jgi:hypothetical protein